MATEHDPPVPPPPAGQPPGPGDDPLADPALAEVVYRQRLAAADHAVELEQPPGWDPLEAVARFLTLVRDVNAIVGEECEADLWPGIRAATFHGEVVLPPGVVRDNGFAVVRASNFGGLIAVLNDDEAVRPAVLADLWRRFERRRYTPVPSALLRRSYAGHHRATRTFATWRDRLFGYL
jgi:hypothetical protein